MNLQAPSQLPVNVTRASYQHVLEHGISEFGIFACKATGARIMARMVQMKIYNRTTNLFTNYAPVAVLYCNACDKVPNTHGGDKIYEDMLQTLSL